jgi:hypothetical protein
LPLPFTQRVLERVAGENDLNRLNALLDQVLTAGSWDELFANSPA